MIKGFVIGLTPVFAAFEVAQLLVAQRYIGIDQIRRNVHPLDLAKVPPGWLSTGWLLGLMADYVCQASLLFVPEFGVKFAAVLLILVSVFGFAARRVCGLRWGLVLLTPECAARAGFYVFVFNMMILHSAQSHTHIPGWLYRTYTH
jgi:hypothetical protein